jgi:serine/threonine-protein phosphatase PGAM5
MGRRIGRERTLTLIRHGEAQGSNSDATLTELGQAEADAAGQYIARLSAPRVIWCSDMARAVETASRVRQALPATPSLHRTVELRECLPGRPALERHQDRPFEELVFQSGLRQADRAFARFFMPARITDKHEVLVTHANLIRALVCRALGVDPFAWTHFDVGTASVTRIRIDSDRHMRLLCFNERAFLDPLSDVPS